MAMEDQRTKPFYEDERAILISRPFSGVISKPAENVVGFYLIFMYQPQPIVQSKEY